MLSVLLPMLLYHFFADGTLKISDDSSIIGALAAIAVIGAFLGSVSISAMTQVQQIVCEYPFSDYLKEEKVFDLYLFFPQFVLLMQLSLIIYSGLSSYCVVIGMVDTYKDEILLSNATLMLYVVTKTWGLVDLLREVAWHKQRYTQFLHTFQRNGSFE
jgi:hypothetical protein